MQVTHKVTRRASARSLFTAVLGTAKQKEITMIVTMELKLDTDEAEVTELVVAVRRAILRALEFSNGDAMYLDDRDVSIVVKDVSVGTTRIA